ncbi:MAG: LLM class flavin-dependent oxidoreductase, partial [Ardenticatenaceae bacterium]
EVVNDALNEAELSDRLGFDSVWLGEHHFDGACSYVDPLTFAGAVVARTERVKIGFSAVQMALYHPVRLAEQIALLDNLSKGRIILGTGRGTAFNFYEYRGYGIPFSEAQERLLEAEEIIQKAWTTPNYRHEGKHWKVEIPVLRPRVYQRPHPPIIRALATEGTLVEMAKQGRPFMMVVQPDEVTAYRFGLYRKTMAKAGYDDEAIARNLENCWIWRNVFVAETDAEAERIGSRAYRASREHISSTRGRLNTAEEMASLSSELSNPRHTVEHGIIFGSPATVCERIDGLRKMGVGGLIIHFRVGPMSWEDNERSIRLFAEKVAPEFQSSVAAD